MTASGRGLLDQIAELEKRIPWARCVRCGDEWSNVAGKLCPVCQGYETKGKERDEWLDKVLGKKTRENCTLEKFQTPTCGHERLKDVCVNFRPDTDNLFIYGPCGIGKSHLAAALMQEWFDALQGSVSRERATGLVRRLRGLRGNEEADIIETLAKKRLLVIDDIGVGKSTEFVISILYDIVDARIEAGRNGLIITSNLTMSDIADKFGDDRLTSRLTGMCKVIGADLNDWRLAEKP